MKKVLLIVAIFIGSLQTLYAQFYLRGTIVDSSFKKGLESVSIENMTSHRGTFSDQQGNFELEVKEGDNIYITYLGYKSKSFRVSDNDETKSKLILLALKPVQLKDITIYRGPTEYQKDSIRRASIYKSAFEYKQSKSVMTPVTSIYQKFSKKYKNLRRFQDQIIDNEKQKFIDSRYTAELVHSLTGLEDDSLAVFKNAYPMEYEYARVASELELKMWIKYNFQDYRSKVLKKKD